MQAEPVRLEVQIIPLRQASAIRIPDALGARGGRGRGGVVLTPLRGGKILPVPSQSVAIGASHGRSSPAQMISHQMGSINAIVHAKIQRP